MTLNPRILFKRLIHGFQNAQMQDPRWSGRVRWGPYLLIPITCLFLLYLLFTIIAICYSAARGGEWKEYSHRSSKTGELIKTKSYQRITPIHWDDRGSAATAVILRFLVPIIEAVHIPLHARAFIKGTLHPVSALCVCILFVCVWGTATPMYFFWDIDVFSEIWYTDNGHVWYPMTLIRITISGLIGMLYLVYMCFAACAVHYYRRENKGKGEGRTKRGSKRLEDGVELGNVAHDEDRKTKDVDDRVDSAEFGQGSGKV